MLLPPALHQPWCLSDALEPIHSNNWAGQKLNFFSSLADKLGVPELLLTLKKRDFFLVSLCNGDIPSV